MSPTACLTHKESQYSLLSPISGHRCLSFIQSITRSLICWCPLGLALCWVEKTHWLITLIPGPPHEAPWLEELSFSCCLTTRPFRGILILQFWPCHWASQRSLNCLPLTPFLWPTMTFPCWGWRELWECDICSSLWAKSCARHSPCITSRQAAQGATPTLFPALSLHRLASSLPLWLWVIYDPFIQMKQKPTRSRS